MHMVDSENDLLQPQSKKDITLRELHDPIEGDSADISWRGNSDVKANACEQFWLLYLVDLGVDTSAR